MGKADRAQWTLAAPLLILTLAVAAKESRSPAAAALRAQKPMSAALLVKAGGKTWRHLALYRPDLRTLNLLYLGGKDAPEGPAASWAQEKAWAFDIDASAAPRGDPALDMKARFIQAALGPSFWKNLPALLGREGPPRQGLSLLDRVLLAREARRLKPQDVRPAWLPAEPEQAQRLLERLAAGKAPGPRRDRPLAAEVLNASGRNGVASEVTKVLRLSGIDVVYYGNAAVDDQTVVYDRTGDFENALGVAALLECANAEAATQISRQKLVDVTVTLGASCFAAAPTAPGAL